MTQPFPTGAIVKSSNAMFGRVASEEDIDKHWPFDTFKNDPDKCWAFWYNNLEDAVLGRNPKFGKEEPLHIPTKFLSLVSLTGVEMVDDDSLWE